MKYSDNHEQLLFNPRTGTLDFQVGRNLRPRSSSVSHSHRASTNVRSGCLGTCWVLSIHKNEWPPVLARKHFHGENIYPNVSQNFADATCALWAFILWTCTSETSLSPFQQHHIWPLKTSKRTLLDKSMLAVSSHLLLLHVTWHYFQKEVEHDLPSAWSKADLLWLPKSSILPFFKMNAFPVIRDFHHLP